MAFGTVSFSGCTESLLAIMAGAAEFTLLESSLGDRIGTLFHLENFGMAVRAFQLVLRGVGLVAESYRPQGAAFGFKLDIPSPHFRRRLLLGIGHSPGSEANHGHDDDNGFPNSLPQFFSPFPCLITFAAVVWNSDSTTNSLSAG